MKYTGVYAITDDTLLPGESLLPAVEKALAAGLAMLQYRSKSASADVKLSQALQLKKLCQQYHTPLIINDDVELCLQIKADGVHLGQNDSKLTFAREKLGSQAIIGVTCHASLANAEKAQQAGASYVAFGRFFPSSTKPLAPAADLEILTRAKSRLSLPVVAIGGINADNCAAVISAGADMAAVIHSIFASDDIASAVKRLNQQFDASKKSGKAYS